MVLSSERSAIGAERGHCQIYQVEQETEEVIDVDLTVALAERVESARNDSQKAMERFAISVTGRERDRFLLFLNPSVLPGKVDDHEQTMAQDLKDSETASNRQLHGVNVDKTHRRARDHQDASSRNDQLLSVPQLLLSRTTNGVPRCDLMHHLPNHRSHPAMAAKPLHPQLPVLPQL